MRRIKKSISILLMIMLMTGAVTGCGSVAKEEQKDNVLGENIILTETGEVIQKYPQPTEKNAEEAVEEATPQAEEPAPEAEQAAEVAAPDPTEEPEPADDGRLQLVFLGDSIFDNARDGTGVPYLTSVQCDAHVYNLAIGGTSASMEPGEPNNSEEWDSQGLVGIVKVLEGDVPTDCFEGYKVKELLDDESIDWSNTDYFIVEYGINDFLRKAPISCDDDDFYDPYSYTGALRYASANLSKIAPDATIILCCPHFVQFFDGDKYVGDGNTVNNGYGTLFDYKSRCQYVANEQGVYYFDAYLDIGIDGYTAADYLEDGIHLSKEGRQLYADELAKMILRIEETKNN